MKRTRQLVTLLLTLVLLLSLAPQIARADPPQGECREGGQHIWDVYSDSATCTAGGTRYWRCRKCGIWWNEASPALGHDWNEGILIQEEGLLGQQKMHYYCNRCGETKDEIVEPSGPDLMEALRRLAGNGKGSSGLVITLQPVGGALQNEADASLTLTVAAEGGVEPYTYEWRGVDKGVTEYLDGNPVGYAVHSNSRRAAEEAARRRAEFFEHYLNYTREHFGVEDAEGAQRSWTELQIREYGDIELSSGDSPSYEAEIGNCSYYCIVRDAEGHSAESERAFVAVPLYIAQQPEDVTMRDGKAVLSCGPAGGSGTYSFSWYLEDKNHPVGTNSSALIANEPGKYFCVVTDGDQTVTSFTATVEKEVIKSDAAPVITLHPKSTTLSARSSNHYSVKLTCKAKLSEEDGGKLVYCWQKKGANGWATVQRGSSASLTRSGKSGRVCGQYRCIVINSTNGKRVVSKTAAVQVQLSCSNFRFVSHKLCGTILGGTPPYKVVVVQYRPKDKEHLSVRLFTMMIGSSGKFSKLMNPNKYRYYSYFSKENGNWGVKRARACYCIIIYDSAGHVYTSKTIPYKG